MRSLKRGKRRENEGKNRNKQKQNEIEAKRLKRYTKICRQIRKEEGKINLTEVIYIHVINDQLFPSYF